ncbi:MAG: aldo/keto reductase [Devosia sp.]
MPDRISTEGTGRFALGSWHIFSRLSLEDGADLVRRALDLGIDLFDVGDYWDHALSNEERFRDIVRYLGLGRSDYRVGIKVFTNSLESRDALVRQSLYRLGIEQADYVVCSRPAVGETLDDAVTAMARLVSDGLTREIAASLWAPDMLADAMDLMAARGLPRPRFLQLQYNVCRRDVVESEPYQQLFARTGILMQAADTLEGGILAGHLHRERYNPGDRDRGHWFRDRNIPRDSGGIRPAIRAKVPELEAAAARMGATPAQLAMAFCLLHPALDTLLFGATRGDHIAENLGALALALARPDDVREAVAGLAVAGAAAPPIFDVSAGMH